MDTKPIKPEDNKGGTFTQQLLVGEVTTAYVSPVPAEAPGFITAEPGTVKEEAIWFRTRDAGAGTIGGLVRDFTNLNGGVGQQHENGEDWEVFQSARYITNIIDILLEGFFQEQAVVARTADTTFTVVGNKSIFYTGGRLIRCNVDNAEIKTVASSAYDGGTGLTTVTITGTLPATLTTVEVGLQPKTATYLSDSFYTAVATLTNKTITSPKIGVAILDTNGNEVIETPATASAVNQLEVVNSATGNPVQINAKGDDTNIDLNLGGKGTGVSRHSGTYDGWVKSGDNWAYASANTITVPSGAASKYAKGDRIKWTQTTVKYGVIIGVADTVLTIAINTDFVVTNAAISANYYSHELNPVGFPDYFAFTPTFTNFAIGNGYNVGYFKVIGKQVFVNNIFNYGTVGSSVSGAIGVSCPITSSAHATEQTYPIRILDNGTNSQTAIAHFVTTTRLDIYALGTAAAYLGWAATSSTVPMTWAANDVVYMNYNYEMA